MTTRSVGVACRRRRFRHLCLSVFGCTWTLLSSCQSLSPKTSADPAQSNSTVPSDARDAFAKATAIVAIADTMAARDLWPGFTTQQTPVAMYDGVQTVLFRHPAPPDGFAPLAGTPGAHVYTGRYPALTANSSAEFGRVTTATLMPATGSVADSARAGVLVHELFHVFQRTHHPGWSANEAELFTYPGDSLELLVRHRLETAALSRALRSEQLATTRCWTREALHHRATRFASMSDGAVLYERHTELNEGLASYVARRATNAPDSTILPHTPFPPDAVRERAYQTGVALSRLLDRVLPTWRDTLELKDTTKLDVLLSTVVSGINGSDPACAVPSSEVESIRARARTELSALRMRRLTQRHLFNEQPGWRITVVSGRAPLFPQGFDPLNVLVVAPGEVLHRRFVKLGNDRGSIEVLDRASLSVASGAHPLFNGVRSLTITGIPNWPVLNVENERVSIRADGISGQFQGATIERNGQAITVRIP